MNNDEQYAPDEEQVRAWCREGTGDYPDVMDEWLDRFLARIRRDALATAEHRAIRAEAQSDIRGRAVVMYRERAREAEAERNEWKALALQERAAALDALEQIKARDARAADIWDEGWEQGMAYVTGMERGTDDDHAITNPYKASETA